MRPTPDALGQRIIALAGPVGANKRAITEALKKAIPGSTSVKFAEPLRRLAKVRHIDEPSYRDLQDIGYEFIEERGWLGYSFETLRRAELDRATILVDGLRHVMAVNALRRLQRTTEVVVIYVDASAEEQRAHLLERDVPERELDAIFAHPVEAESHIVRYLADHHVRSGPDVAFVADHVKNMFEKSLRADRDEMFREQIIAPTLLEAIWEDRERFEAMREVFRLAGRSLGDYTPLRAWLNAPLEIDSERRTPLGLIRDGDPDAVVRYAIDFVLQLESARFPNSKLMAFWGASADDPRAAKRSRLVDQAEGAFSAQGIVLDEFGRGLKGRYLSGEISLHEWSRLAIQHFGAIRTSNTHDLDATREPD